ncbi:MAG TPA: hypothetical protein VHY91_10135 [Pirellulales bacterium]|nr:hypothetical protein [Pirellulales bacterium]
MKEPGDAPRQRFRIWIAGYDDWQPTDWRDVPPRAIAREPAEALVLSAAQAESFVEGFNREMLRKQSRDGRGLDGNALDGNALDGEKRLWAVAVPVVVRYEGDPHPGQILTGHRF